MTRKGLVRWNGGGGHRRGLVLVLGSGRRSSSAVRSAADEAWLDRRLWLDV
jgi:hypothetical protein